MTKKYILQDSRLLDADVGSIYKKLIDPAEQLKWNSLYLDASIEPKGDAKNGTVMTGNFKGSGKAKIVFQNVKPNQEFTHYSKMKLFNAIPLGEFHHIYRLEPKDNQTLFTQNITFEPKGLGVLLKNFILKSFKERLPESFDEFEEYISK